MKKVIVIIGVVGLLAFGLVNFAKIPKPESSPLKTSQTTTTQSSPTLPTETKVVTGATQRVIPNRYLEFTPQVLAENIGKRRVLFFYASWCPTCIPADQNFLENSQQLPEDVVLIRVNYNDSATDQIEKDLAKKYMVTYQHTYVQIDDQGETVTMWNGGEIEELLSNLK